MFCEKKREMEIIEQSFSQKRICTAQSSVESVITDDKIMEADL